MKRDIVPGQKRIPHKQKRIKRKAELVGLDHPLFVDEGLPGIPRNSRHGPVGLAVQEIARIEAGGRHCGHGREELVGGKGELRSPQLHPVEAEAPSRGAVRHCQAKVPSVCFLQRDEAPLSGGIPDRADASPDCSIIRECDVERFRIGAWVPVDHETADRLPAAEVDDDPRLRRTVGTVPCTQAPPVGRDERSSGSLRRRNLHAGENGRQIVQGFEPEVVEPERSTPPLHNIHHDLHAVQHPQLPSHRRTPAVLDLVLPDPDGCPGPGHTEAGPVHPPDIVDRVLQADNEVVHGSFAANVEGKAVVAGKGGGEAFLYRDRSHEAEEGEVHAEGFSSPPGVRGDADGGSVPV